MVSSASDFNELYSELADQAGRWSELQAEMGRCYWVNISRALDSRTNLEVFTILKAIDCRSYQL